MRAKAKAAKHETTTTPMVEATVTKTLLSRTAR